MKLKIIVALLIIICSISCEDDKKKTSNEDPNQTLNFETLTAEKTTIEPGEQTRITATATGYLLSYQWSATAGDILGSGTEVVYAASPCHIGSNEISCTVKDGNSNSQTKTIIIHVE